MRHRLHLKVVASLIWPIVLLLTLWLCLSVSIASAQDATQEPTTETTQESTVEVPTTEPTVEATTEPTTEATLSPVPTNANVTIYVVRSGDTLARIAQRFSTTVNVIAIENGITNVNLIYTGQRLRIPNAQNVPAATPTIAGPTPIPTATIAPGNTYTVQRGDTLFKIAVRFKTTVAQLVALNNIRNQNLIYTGQKLILPASADATPAPNTPVATATTAATTAATSAPQPTVAATQAALPDPGFAYGISVFTLGQDTSAVAGQITQLGMAWVRLDVYWRDIEITQGQPDFAALDQAVEAFDAAGLNILLTVTTAPDWARTRLEEEGPPDDFNLYAQFIGSLAARYAGRVDAYQVWYEPNLRREWFSDRHRISAESYTDLLRGAYLAVKNADSSAKVITAGLSPTGFNDGFNAINDRAFLSGLYGEFVPNISDAIGAHPGGWANPPDATCCAASEGVTTHYEDRSFYFRDTLNDYRAIMSQNNDNRPLWVTKFGWGSSADLAAPSENSGYIYITYTDLTEQATYDAGAFALADELGFVGPMFLYNLNGCVATPVRPENCYASLIGPDGAPRPVFAAVEALRKSDSPSPVGTPIPFDEPTPIPTP